MKKHYNFKTLTQGVKSLVAILMVTLMAAGNVFAQTQQYQLINEGQTDWSGTYLLVSAPTTGAQAGKVVALNGVSTTSTPYGLFEDVTAYMTGDVIASNTTTDAVAVTIAAGSNGYTIYQAGVGYYGWSSGNSLKAAATASDNHYEWTFSVANGELTISNASDPSRHLQFNAGSPRFASYTSVQVNCKLYKLGAETPVAVAAPTFTVASGTYFAVQTVTLEGPAGASIYYTTDGTTPNASSTEYTAPIAVNATTTIKAIAVLGSETSSVATATYTIRIPVEVANIAAFKAAAGNDVYKITGPVTVIGQYSNKYHTFVQDNTGALYIYGTMANAYTEGDVISNGVYGTYQLYYGLAEMKPVNGLPTGQGVTGTPVQPVVATLADIVNNYADYEAKLVTVNGVTIAADHTFGTTTATRGVNISQGNTTAQIYNTMNTITGKQVRANDEVNVTGYVIRHDNTVEIVPRSTSDIVETVASLPFVVDFDNATDQGFTNISTQANKWFVGQASGFDNNKLFITSNNGATNKYENDLSVAMFGRKVRIPATGATLTFDYRVQGNENDYLVVLLSLSGTTGALQDYKFYGSNEWRTATIPISPDLAGELNIVFSWINNADGVVNQFPAAIDNISIVEATCVQPTALNTTVNGTTAVVTWTAPADQTAWTVEYKHADHSEWHSMNASTTSVTLAGLDGNTTYDVRVKANCGATSSAWTTGQFTIDCQNSIQASIDRTIGDGSTTNSYLPFYGTYNYTYSQQIYDAAELNIPAGPITEISFYCTTAPTSTTTGNIRIWMANTTKSTFADNTDYIDPSTLTQVAYVEGNRPFTTGWNTFTLSQPFMYDGTSNLVVAYYEGYDTWNGGSFWAQSTTDNKSISHYSDTYSAVSYSDPANASGSKYFNKYRSDIKLVGSGVVCNDQPACAEPTNLTVTDVTNYTANLAWTAGDSTQVSWTVEYKTENAASWTAVNVASTTYNMVGLDPNTHYMVRVKANCSTTSSSEYIAADFTTLSACIEPSAVEVVSVVGTRVELTWTPLGNESAWVVEYKKATENTWVSVPVSNAPWITLNGLSALTNYDVRVKAVCGSNSESNWIATTFTTGCENKQLPYEEGFEDYATQTSDIECWAFINNNGYSGTYPKAYVNSSTTYIHTGSRSLYFQSAANESVYAIMPAIDADDATLSFWYRNEGTTASNGVLSVGYLTNVNNENTFVTLQTLPKITTMTRVDINVGSLAGKRLAFKYAGGTANNYYLGIDDISVIQTPRCLNPEVITVSNIQNTSADVAWTPRGNGLEWEVEYGVSGFAHGSGTTVTSTLPSVTLTGLTEGTHYDVYVRTICTQEQSNWSDVVNFTTTTSGGGTDCTNPVEIEIGTGTSAVSTVPFNTYYRNSRNETIYPQSELGGPCMITGIRYYSNGTASLATTNVKIYLATTANSTFSSTSSWTPASDLTLVYDANNVTLGGEVGWQTFTFDVPFFYDGSANLVVCVTKTADSYNNSVTYRYTSETNSCLYRQNDTSPVDDLTNTTTGSLSSYRSNAKFVTCPVQVTCPSPVVSSNMDITAHSITLSWTPGGSETQWEVSYTLNGTTNTFTTTNTSLTIGNLDAATAYTIPFSITAVCSATDQSFPVNRTLTFMTECEPKPMLYTEDFDNLTTTSTSFSTSIMPTCWERAYTGTNTSYGAGVYYSTSLANSDARFLRLYNYATTSTSTSYGDIYAILPEMDIDLDLAAITFQARRSSTTSYSSTFKVGIVTDVNNPAATFTPIQTITPSGTTYQSFTVSLEGHHAGRIAFFMDKNKESGKTGSYNYACIDDIEVYPRQVTCPNPVLSTTLSATNNTVTVHWTPGGSETEWEVTYTVNGTTTTATTTTPSFTITGLTSATEYTIPVSVVAVCSATDHSFASNRTFTFETECDPLALPYNENFDSYATTSTSISTSEIPICWKRHFTGTSTSYGAGIYYSSTYASSGERSLRFYQYFSTASSSGNIYVILPEFDVDLADAAISFQARRSTTTNYSSMFQVGVVTDLNNLAGTYTPVDTIMPSGTTYEPFTVSFEGHHTGHIVFFMNQDKEDSRTGAYNYAYIDDIQVYQAVFTRDLNLISVEGIEDNCDLSNVPVTFTVQNDNATADVTSFRASYSINGGTPVTETFTPTALASGQQATFTFAQGANFTDSVNSITVTLLYGGDGNPSNDVYTIDNIRLITPSSLPYSEDFTNVVMGQGGWIADSRNANPLMWTVVNGTPTYTFSNDYDAASYMVSPCINIPAGQYVISYDYNALGVLPENMTVYVASSPAPADWTVINQHQGFTHTAADKHVDYIFNNDASGVYYIVVKAASVRGSYGMTFDNLNIAPAVTVTVNTGANGTSIPNGAVTVASGSDYTVHFLPTVGYHVASISVDGVQVMGEDNSNSNVFDYTLHNVTANTTVYATFTATNIVVKKYVNTTMPFGHFVPATPETVPYGGNATLTFNVDNHYHLSSLLVSDYEYEGNNTLANAMDVLPAATRTGNTYTYTLNNLYHNKYVLANVRIDTVGLFYTVYGHGVIENTYVTDANSPVPALFSRYVDYGTTFTATFVPAAGYHVQSVTINGVNYGAIEAYQFANISEQQNVEVVFAPNTYVITTNGYGPGMVTPGATFVYDPANTYYFAATPATGYRIASVLRNNVPMTIADPEATFRDTLTNILDNYHYEVSFNPMDYNVTATCGANGIISPMGVASYHYNNQGVYTVTANQGYYISSVTVDGVTTNFTQADALTTYTYTFNFTGANAVDHTISATFASYQYTVTVTTPTNGTITPGTTTYNYGQSPVFAITPAAGYGIVNVMVDGVNVGAVTSYQFPALTADHTLSATFAQYQYVITATAGNGGTISPVGATNMVSGGNQTYTITPATGYHITDVFVDGASVGAVGTYTFSNVTANHTIFAAFDVNEYTITVTQPANGAITPGTTTVTYGATPTFVVTPNTGYSVTAITLNGTNVMSQAQNTNGVYTYTLPAVSANATLTATMTQKTFTITKNAGSNGAINGPATANYGATASYTIVPNAGYVVDNVVVDGMNMGAITSYTFVNVVANHTIAATFRLEDCVIPTNMHTTDITTTSATFSWYHPTATSFEVQYKPILGTTFNTVTVNADNYTVTTLQPSTTYVWMVRANCGNNNYSAWSNGQSFRTKDEIPDGIEDYTAQELINVYASHSDIHIVNEYGVQIDNVEVYDVYGKLLYSGHVTSSNEVISMNVAVGTYMVRLTTDKGNATYKLYLTK